MAAAIAGGWQGPASDAAGRFITALAASRSRDAAEQQAAVLAAKLEGATANLAQQTEAHAEARKLVAQEAHRAAERMAQAQAERDEARKLAAEAREQTARLAGQFSANQEQTAALLARLAPTAEDKPATRKKGTPTE